MPMASLAHGVVARARTRSFMSTGPNVIQSNPTDALTMGNSAALGATILTMEWNDENKQWQ